MDLDSIRYQVILHRLSIAQKTHDLCFFMHSYFNVLKDV